MKLLLSVDEKWPVFDLTEPEVDEEANCICSNALWMKYHHIIYEYKKLQMELKHFYDEQQQKSNEPIGNTTIPESILAEHNSQHSIILPSENKLWPLLHESSQ